MSQPRNVRIEARRRRRAGASGGSMRAVVRAIRATLHAEDVRGRAVSVLLTNDAEIRALNARYAGNDKATDVLAFSLDEVDGPKDESLGDVVISVERARVQANARHVVLDQELELLAVHGTLHLLGFDHDEPERARMMRRKTRAIRAAIRRNQTRGAHG